MMLWKRSKEFEVTVISVIRYSARRSRRSRKLKVISRLHLLTIANASRDCVRWLKKLTVFACKTGTSSAKKNLKEIILKEAEEEVEEAERFWNSLEGITVKSVMRMCYVEVVYFYL